MEFQELLSNNLPYGELIQKSNEPSNQVFYDANMQGGVIAGGTIKKKTVFVDTVAGLVEGRSNMPWDKFYLIREYAAAWVTSGIGTHTETQVYDITRLTATSPVGGSYSRLTTGAGLYWGFQSGCNISGKVKFDLATGFSAFMGVAGRLSAGEPDASGDIVAGGNTSRHIGFVVDSAGNLYASHSNDTTQVKTPVTGIDITTAPRYRAIFYKNSDDDRIEFYVNEELVATHRTYLPGSGSLYGPDFKIIDWSNTGPKMDVYNNAVFAFDLPE